MWRLSEKLGLELGIENFSDEEYIQGSQSDWFAFDPRRSDYGARPN